MKLHLVNRIQKGFFPISGKKALIAFSGGVDSTVVAVLAKTVCKEVKLITITSEVISEFEVAEAKSMADLVGLSHEVLHLSIGSDHFWENPPDRCYFCKRYIFTQLKELAKDIGYDVVLDGTNASDTVGHRPGLKALKELGIYSPLLEANITKTEVRKIAADHNLPIAEKPAMACLASRIPYGTKITLDKLKRVELGEEILKEFKISEQIRLRDHGSLARIEVDPIDFPRLFKQDLLTQIIKKLKKIGYIYVCLDLEGYRPSIPT